MQRPDKHQQVSNNFTYHVPKPEQVATYEDIRASAAAFAFFLLDKTPESREQSLALTHLEEVVMWANAAIARNT